MLSLSTTVTYDFLAIEDTSKDKVMDVLFVFKDTEGSKNNTCAGAGTKCSPVLINMFWGLHCIVYFFVIQPCTVGFFFFQVCPRHVFFCQQWMGLMEKHSGSVRWILSTTGPSVVWMKEQAESGTVCCPILTSSRPLTNTLVSDTLLCLCLCDTNDTNFVTLNFYATFTDLCIHANKNNVLHWEYVILGCKKQLLTLLINLDNCFLT